MFSRISALLILCLALALPTSASADLAADKAALERKIADEQSKIDNAASGVSDAKTRLNSLDRELTSSQSELDRKQRELTVARIKLTKLENSANKAEKALASNLAGSYKVGKPSLLTVVLQASGFSDLLERFSFLKRVSQQNGEYLVKTRDAKADVKHQTDDLKASQSRLRNLISDAQKKRDQVDVIHAALLKRQLARLSKQGASKSKLRKVNGQLAAIQRQQLALARAQAPAPATNTANSGQTNSSSGGGSSSSAGSAPSGSGSVAKVIAAANEIATMPYKWGGGHGSLKDSGYDCSGSLSYALAAAGLISTPLDSTGFMSWGQAGPGKHITVYANAGHAYMVVNGRRFDTTALRASGNRWTSQMRSSAGFVARHPPGL